MCALLSISCVESIIIIIEKFRSHFTASAHLGSHHENQKLVYILQREMANFYREIVDGIVNEFSLNIVQKIKENNTFPVNIADPPRKRVISYPLHQAVFCKCFAKLLKTEKIGEFVYKLCTINRLETVLGCKTLVRFNKFNDMALICPFMVVENDID